MKSVPGPFSRTASRILSPRVSSLLVACLAWCLTACPSDDGARRASPYRPYHSHEMVEGNTDICIVTQYTSNIDTYARIAIDNHQSYAHEHGHHYSAFRGRISKDAFSDPSHPERLYRDGLYWQKIAAVQKRLAARQEETGERTCRWVMWVDADTLFTNFQRDVEVLLSNYEDKSVVIARDPADTVVNAGVFFVQNTPAGREFIDTVAERYSTYKYRDLPEQEAIQDLIFGSDLRTPGRCRYDRMRDRLRNDVAILPQRTFNAFYKPGERGGEVYWEPCDFIAHFAALNTETRIEHMHRVIDEMTVCPP